ncbi:hypothetical protein [Candidatus Mycoplasma haematohominis]|uniref:hypothetical protein n=1 Tax=Candidatus Mycoplasma haematohominis TaxID=1494318 RepID=UPI001C0A719E|nr:hypothetical protein [Candidatus Mycoplasma haemohominis]
MWKEIASSSIGLISGWASIYYFNTQTTTTIKELSQSIEEKEKKSANLSRKIKENQKELNKFCEYVSAQDGTITGKHIEAAKTIVRLISPGSEINQDGDNCEIKRENT